MKNISIKKIGVFVSAVESGSFSNSAKKLHISQPAAINIIDEIEDTIGDPLFVRTGKIRKVALTPRGEEVYRNFSYALATYNNILSNISDNKKNQRQTLLIQTPYSSSVSMDWLQSVITNMPKCDFSIRLVEWEQIKPIMDNDDKLFVLLDGNVQHPRSDYFQLDTFDICFVAPQSNKFYSIDEDSISWEDIPKETVIYTGINPQTVNSIYQNIEKAQHSIKNNIAMNCVDLLASYIFETGCPAIIPKVIANSFKNIGKIRCLDFSHSKLFMPFGILLPYGQRTRFKMEQYTKLQSVFESFVLH